MLTIARAPLAPLVTNTHYAMSASDDRASKRTTRRTSARLSEKENVGISTNGTTGSDDAIAVPTRGGRGKGKANAATATATAKRKQDYDEEDDGFAFTRKKKPKTSAAAKVPEPVKEVEEEYEGKNERAAATQSQKKGWKKREASVEQDVLRDREQNRLDVAPPRRRGARAGTTERDDGEPAPIEVKKKRRSKAKTPEAEPEAPDDGARGRSRQPAPTSKTPPVAATQTVVTQIALPFADTPVIRRNQAMRRGTQGSRRSSLGNRGRRASSLIDSGRSSALPHANVESVEFFKHIESGLPEIRRMKQLLTWCATRALSEKDDAPVRMAAREIQRQILEDFSIRDVMSNWFGRPETAAGEVPETAPLVKKPNPKNVANEAKILELEQQLQRLQSERATWERLLRPPNKNVALPPPPPGLPQPGDMSAELLSASNASILERLQNLHLPPAPHLQQETRTKLDTATKDIEFQTDLLADNVHILGQYRTAAEKVAKRVLGDAATALEVRSRKERERSGTEEVGVRDVLRGLSRVERPDQP